MGVFRVCEINFFTLQNANEFRTLFGELISFEGSKLAEEKESNKV